MEIWKELLTTFEGQLSITVILVTIIMMIYFARMFIKKTLSEPQDNSKK